MDRDSVIGTRIGHPSPLTPLPLGEGNRMRRAMGAGVMVMLSFLIAGCCPSGETIIRDTVAVVRPPVIGAEMPAQVWRQNWQQLRPDSVTAVRVVEHDTIIDVRYFPSEKIVRVKVKPDSVIIRVRDTSRVVRTVFEEYSAGKKFLLFLAGFAIAIGAAVVLKIKKT